MGCNSSRDGTNPRPVLKGLPDFKNSKSLLSKYLTQEVFDELKDKKDNQGATLADLINSGVVNLDSGIGVYAGSPNSYIVFAKLFDRIIEDYHGHKPDAIHKSRWDSDKCDFPNFDPEGKFCVSTRIRVARNLDAYPLGTFISRQ